MRISLMLMAALFALPLQATTWQLAQTQSQVSFTTIKKEHIAENHTFSDIQATLDNKGAFAFSINLNSVDTAIAIRDERMKEHLFNTKKFTTATYSATVDSKTLRALAVGSSVVMPVAGKLSLHGKEQLISTKVMVSKLQHNKILVNSLSPMLVKAGDFGLVAGVNKLKELAGLPSIGNTVPVNFVLTLVQK